MKEIKLQAHKGVASECPENTMSAFKCAAVQGYDVIELDLGYTLDNQIVVLHDALINRTAREMSGKKIESEININKITYAEALNYDFGIGFSSKYRGEKIPLFKDVLAFAEENKIRLKIDNKIQYFPPDILEVLFSLIKNYTDLISITSNNLEFIKKCISLIPEAAIDYDGEVNADILENLTKIVPQNKLTVWLPQENKNTSWASVSFADESLSTLIKKYAQLGIWRISDFDDFFDAIHRFDPDIVETEGTIKPEQNANCRYDMHTHSENSHDSKCPVADMANQALKNSLKGFAVTDHCDIEYCQTIDLDGMIKSAASDVFEEQRQFPLNIIKGIEIGEGFWHPEVTEKIIAENEFDVIVSSVHAVKFTGYEIPYSKIDFEKMGRETTLEYISRYFDDILRMIRTCDFDILAHLTCPFRYINGKYHMNIDPMIYIDKIKVILSEIIRQAKALEVNSSCVFPGSSWNEFMPQKQILDIYKEMGGYLITTASDAHIAQNSANSFDELYSMLKSLGFINTYYYKNRCAIPCAIK